MTLQFEGVGFGTGTGSGGKIGTVVLVAMGSQPSTPYTVGSKWFYNGKIYTATSTSAHDSGVVPSYDTAYLFNGTYYYWDGSTLQGADESNLVHISGTETITGDKTFSGKSDFQGETTVVTQPTSDSSQKAASTQFVKDYVEDGEWQKPSDWVNIRSGALDNSIYFLVAHSKPTESGGVYSVDNYPKFAFRIGVSTEANTYDVFVDGIKIATTASGTITEIDWAALYTAGTIVGGYDIMHPSELTTHIVRITPTVETDTLIQIASSQITGQTQQGILWVHFELDNAIRVVGLLGGEFNPRNLLCQAVTAQNDKLKFINTATGNTGLYQIFIGASSLAKTPILEQDGNETHSSSFLCFSSVPAKKIKLKNNSEEYGIGIIHSFKGEYIETENPLRLFSGTGTAQLASNANNLKKFPAISTTQKGTTCIITRLDSIEETFIYESFNDERTLLRINGASGHQTNLIGLVVSSSAPFSYATAPQISIQYTNMSRAALVRLFNSMPTVSDSQEIDITGAIGAGDLTAEDIAIVTGKGWTLTR